VAPHRYQYELVYRNTELEKIAGMHIDAICTAVYLRNPQINKIDQFFCKATFLEIDVHSSESLVTFRRNLGVVDAIAHDESSYLPVDGSYRVASWPILEGP
jgi:hypothetical protein